MTGTLLVRETGRRAMLGHSENSSTTTVVGFTVSVVDGSGVEVYGEPVTATFHFGDGYHRTVTRATGRDGRARFVDAAGDGVTLAAGRESLGPVMPTPGDHFVIEA